MNERDVSLISRAQLAHYAEVSRAAVTNWQKRSSDFPEPADAANELFELGQVADWLSTRAVPANARHPHEPVGTTYADRVRANAVNRSAAETPRPSSAPSELKSGPDEDETQRRVWRWLDLLRGHLHVSETCEVLLALLHMCAMHETAWQKLVQQAGRPADLPEEAAEVLSPQTHALLARVSAATFCELTGEIARLGAGDQRRERLADAFDYTLSAQATALGKRGGNFRTPDAVVATAFGLLTFENTVHHVHDPFCRRGEFLVAAHRWLRSAAPSTRLRFSGTSHTSEDAKRNLEIHDVDSEILGGPISPGVLPDLPYADILLTNPPFNHRRPSAPPDERGLPYGIPPESNSNFAWLQHAIAMLATDGRAVVVMSPSAAYSTNTRENSIRASMVEDGTVEAVVALPRQLFTETAIAVNLWLLCPPRGHCSEVLLVDASELGGMVSRTRRSLSAEDVGAIRTAYRAWRAGAFDESAKPGIGRAVGIEEIREREYSLHPPSYILDSSGSADAEAPARYAELTRRLSVLEARIPQVDARTRHLLKEIDEWMR
ncbi:N-6 DNA methylase [Streptomonospora litoralis]|uniref:Putative type I restriction enzymeP M protein n=1 Tax=Streptomonospora litoralis TaxID=2498135 RepID=A0A4P6Q995_9ACTN|nr:N-6 DNA methylase [Streptomonospora litoralis]QBI55764.1 putative type I restriction enzymeP M protein [Streptomonospora litoralis]